MQWLWVFPVLVQFPDLIFYFIVDGLLMESRNRCGFGEGRAKIPGVEVGSIC